MQTCTNITNGTQIFCLKIYHKNTHYIQVYTVSLAKYSSTKIIYDELSLRNRTSQVVFLSKKKQIYL